eukprot:CAMPEP_0172156812 /NCGR_PEP_ID=MMETSP1050-20130122/3435_1 /TAXON_ID=233186 /ORGANISM="Cryptomonas curvata, Strain CCAP979/52" /LENGTH=150 /DNA_ID=CAMNT_0012825955 /DNA_START=42 /DNA_END=491 /DNA_ORIENTATION=-
MSENITREELSVPLLEIAVQAQRVTVQQRSGTLLDKEVSASDLEHMRRRVPLGWTTRDGSLLVLSLGQHVQLTSGGAQNSQAPEAARCTSASSFGGFPPHTLRVCAVASGIDVRSLCSAACCVPTRSLIWLCACVHACCPTRPCPRQDAG